MQLKQASAHEFIWQVNDELHHVPTKSTFLVRRGKVSALCPGYLLYYLGDDSDYDVESVLDLAWKLAEHQANDLPD